MSNTGDFQLPASIADNTSVNIKLVGVLLSVAFAVGGAYWKIGSMEKRQDDFSVALKAKDDREVEHRLRMQRVEDGQGRMERAIEDLAKDVKRLLGNSPRTPR